MFTRRLASEFECCEFAALVQEVENWCTPASGGPLPADIRAGIEQVRIDRLAHLVYAEQLLDALAFAGLRLDGVYERLEFKVVQFLRGHPQLLVEPWFRNAGAVVDLISELGQETPQADFVLASFRLRRPATKPVAEA